MRRTIHTGLREAWQQTTEHPNALRALEASRSLHRRLSEWQTALVTEALRGGATWEDIGAALGATRQAAWARFRRAVDPKEASTMDHARQTTTAEIRELQRQLRDRDLRWREERQTVEAEFRAAQARLRALDQQRANDRRSLQAELQGKRACLRDLSAKIRNPG